MYSDQQFTLTDPPFFAEAMSSTIIVLGPLGNFLYKLYEVSLSLQPPNDHDLRHDGISGCHSFKLKIRVTVLQCLKVLFGFQLVASPFFSSVQIITGYTHQDLPFRC